MTDATSHSDANSGPATANRVAPWLDDGDLTLYHGDAPTVLQGLPAGIAQTCVTSPPYWGLRDYGTGTWTGGDEACDHVRTVHEDHPPDRPRGWDGAFRNTGEPKPVGYGSTCGKCGAQRVDSQLGLEDTPHEYVQNMVNLFREVRRVLRDDGTLWLNLGDSYNSGAQFNGHSTKNGTKSDALRGGASTYSERGDDWPGHRPLAPGLKPKDLVGIPWRVAFALQADGWYLRSDIIWAKPNPMPESVTDRPTKAHEYLFLFSKQPRYFYDADAIREPPTDNPGGAAFYRSRGQGMPDYAKRDAPEKMSGGHAGFLRPTEPGRNRRSVWTIPTQPFPEAHFATYPEELVRPCILAGTSEKGECSTCGKPWTREVDREIVGDHATPNARAFNHGPNGAAVGGNHAGGSGSRSSGHYEVTTTGWAPSCSCDTPTRPQLVLDPFIGSGTTSLVARKHGRRSLGIDLSTEYLALAAKRTQQLSLLGGVS